MSNLHDIKRLVKLANDLDDKGLHKEADMVDGVILKLAAEVPLPAGAKRITHPGGGGYEYALQFKNGQPVFTVIKAPDDKYLGRDITRENFGRANTADGYGDSSWNRLMREGRVVLEDVPADYTGPKDRAITLTDLESKVTPRQPASTSTQSAPSTTETISGRSVTRPPPVSEVIGGYPNSSNPPVKTPPESTTNQRVDFTVPLQYSNLQVIGGGWPGVGSFRSGVINRYLGDDNWKVHEAEFEKLSKAINSQVLNKASLSYTPDELINYVKSNMKSDVNDQDKAPLETVIWQYAISCHHYSKLDAPVTQSAPAQSGSRFNPLPKKKQS